MKRKSVPDVAEFIGRLNNGFSPGKPIGMCDPRDPNVFEEDGTCESHERYYGRRSFEDVDGGQVIAQKDHRFGRIRNYAEVHAQDSQQPTTGTAEQFLTFSQRYRGRTQYS